MGKVGRVACMATPFILSLGALITLALIFTAGTVKKSPAVDRYYFLKIDLANISISSSTLSSLESRSPSSLESRSPSTTTSSASSASSSSSSSSSLGEVIEEAKDSLGVRDYYTVYLRSSCSWYASNESAYTHCTTPTSFYYFNPETAWDLNSTGISIDSIFPSSLRTGLSLYEKISKAVFLLYVGALTTLIISMVVGFTATLSRWGSFFTSFFAGAAASMYVGASAAATALFLVLRTALNDTLGEDYGIESSVGTHLLVLTWTGAIFAVVASFFRTLSMCCCSGRDRYRRLDDEKQRGVEGAGTGAGAAGAAGADAADADGLKKRPSTRAERQPYTYERVASPAGADAALSAAAADAPASPVRNKAGARSRSPADPLEAPYSGPMPYDNHYDQPQPQYQSQSQYAPQQQQQQYQSQSQYAPQQQQYQSPSQYAPQQQYQSPSQYASQQQYQSPSQYASQYAPQQSPRQQRQYAYQPQQAYQQYQQPPHYQQYGHQPHDSAAAASNAYEPLRSHHQYA